ncbi:hypothetical protein EZV62_022020 [Acer yangbiense]|uniref:CRAL-TRIO domain-containing protein n=1 Tax=Acer yangbiense TaxID=1000413 RepID=A0A5C7H7C6_9ROSI|nr:hypothetical protein EZV62_022020 [Acer yangbiense]
MSEGVKKSPSNGFEKSLPFAEQQAKINEVRKLLGPLPDRLSIYCSDATISRYLTGRNWNVKKATKMLKETLKWRAEYKPEEILWDEVAHEAETGKTYISNNVDKHGRTVLILRPGCQNSKSTKGQIRHLVYCMENAIVKLPPDQGQIVWLIDFHGYNLSQISLNLTRETAIVLQNRYPERLGVAILYNPPKFFEPFWTMAKPFLEPKTRDKVKFVYSDNPNTRQIMEELFDMDQVESAFGGNDNSGFDINKYAERMREEDKKRLSFWGIGNPSSTTPQPAPAASLDSLTLNSDLNTCDNDNAASPSSHRTESSVTSQEEKLVVTEAGKNVIGQVH